jgi:hypothetical protein
MNYNQVIIDLLPAFILILSHDLSSVIDSLWRLVALGIDLHIYLLTCGEITT